MYKRFLVSVLFASMAACAQQAPSSAAQEQEGEWALKAQVAESCSCNVSCPCMFGSPPTHDYCKGSRLIQIEKGRFGQIALDGLPVVVTFSMGEWVKYYVGEEASPEQVRAAGQLISAAFPAFANSGVESTAKAPVEVHRTATTLEFSIPDSAVEMQVMTGPDGRPVRIENLPSFPELIQYKSKRNTHTSGDREFTFSGTNGFTTHVDTSGG